jgi:hypothetical protein
LFQAEARPAENVSESRARAVSNTGLCIAPSEQEILQGALRRRAGSIADLVAIARKK